MESPTNGTHTFHSSVVSVRLITFLVNYTRDVNTVRAHETVQVRGINLLPRPAGGWEEKNYLIEQPGTTRESNTDAYVSVGRKTETPLMIFLGDDDTQWPVAANILSERQLRSPPNKTIIIMDEETPTKVPFVYTQLSHRLSRSSHFPDQVLVALFHLIIRAAAEGPLSWVETHHGGRGNFIVVTDTEFPT